MTWVESRRNYAPVPRGDALLTPSHPAVTQSLITDFPNQQIPTAIRWTRIGSVGNATRVGEQRVGSVMPANGQIITLRMEVNLSEQMTVIVTARPNYSSATNASTLASGIVVPAGFSVIEVTGPSHTGAATTNSGFVMTTSDGQLGATFDATAFMLVQGSTPGEFFDGNTADTTNKRYFFFNNTSVEETWSGDDPDLKLVFNYWASLSNLMPKNGYTLDQHQSDYFEQRGIDWNQPFADQVEDFYYTYGGGESGSLTTAIETYYNSLTGTIPQEWLDEVKFYALGAIPGYDGLSQGVYDFMQYVLDNQPFDTETVYIQSEEPIDYIPYVWFDTSNSETIAIMKLSDGT